jgi:hypothetical protein
MDLCFCVFCSLSTLSCGAIPPLVIGIASLYHYHITGTCGSFLISIPFASYIGGAVYFRKSLFCPVDGDSSCLRNVGTLRPNCVTSHPRGQYSWERCDVMWEWWVSDRCCVLFRERVEEGQLIRCLGYGMELVFDSQQKKKISLLQSVKNVSGAHPAPLWWTPWALSARQSGHWPLASSSATVTNQLSCASIPHTLEWNAQGP